eukprot:3294542-Rhodomonas_salina.1
MEGGKTRVAYKLAIDPGFYVPLMVKQGSTELFAKAALNELRKYTERAETKQAVAARVSGIAEAGGSGARVASRGGRDKMARTQEGKMIAVEEKTEVGATVEECFAVASGYEDYPKWAAWFS